MAKLALYADTKRVVTFPFARHDGSETIGSSQGSFYVRGGRTPIRTTCFCIPVRLYLALPIEPGRRELVLPCGPFFMPQMKRRCKPKPTAPRSVHPFFWYGKACIPPHLDMQNPTPALSAVCKGRVIRVVRRARRCRPSCRPSPNHHANCSEKPAHCSILRDCLRWHRRA